MKVPRDLAGSDASRRAPEQAAELDAVTLRRAQRSEPEACLALVERYQRPVFGFLYRMLGPPRGDRVDHLAHETFLHVLRSLAGFASLGPARLSIWILTLGARRAVEELRRDGGQGGGQEVGHPGEENAVSPARPDPGTRHPAPADLAARVVASLVPVDRAAFLLRLYHGLAYGEIARALDIDVDSVKSRLAGAQAELRSGVAEEEEQAKRTERTEPRKRDGEPGGEKPTRAELDALAAWTVPDPPSGFAHKVVAARVAAPHSGPEPAASTTFAALQVARRRLLPWAVVLVGAVAALLLSQTRFSSRAAAAVSGSAAPTERRSIQLERRGVAVAEAGAVLSWTIGAGRVRIAQRAGNVFYRVERGGSFEVDTAHGAVQVTGSCFRVEVDPMKSIKTPARRAAGGAVRPLLVVTVYEGSVRFTSRSGDEHLVAAGQVLSTGEGGTQVSDAQDSGL